MHTERQYREMTIGDLRGTLLPGESAPVEHIKDCFKFVRPSDQKEFFISFSSGSYIVTTNENNRVREMQHHQVAKLLSLSKSNITAGEAEIERSNHPGFAKSAFGAITGVGAMAVAVTAAGGLFYAAVKSREVYYKAFVVDPIVEQLSQQEQARRAHESAPVPAVSGAVINLSNFLNQPIQITGALTHRVNVFEGTNAGSYYSLSSRALSGDALVLVPATAAGHLAAPPTAGKDSTINGKPVLVEGQVVLRADSIQ